MDSYLEAPFSFEGIDPFAVNNAGNSSDPSSKLQDTPLSPLTLSRLESSWNSSQDQGLKEQSQQQQQQQQQQRTTGTPSSSAGPTHARLASFGDEFDTDFSFFSGPANQQGLKQECQQSYILGRNSLGLLDDTLLHLSPQAPASVTSTAMSHSQSASGVLDNAASSTTGPHRKSTFFANSAESSSNNSPEATSSAISAESSSRHGSISSDSHSLGLQHPSRADFNIIGQSPKSQSPLVGIVSGLNLGTPGTPFRGGGLIGSSPLNGQQPGAFDALNHQNLLMMSQGRNSSDMGPPSSVAPLQHRNSVAHLAKRGSSQEAPGAPREAGNVDEQTPLASSTETFAGQRPTGLSGNHQPSTPFTPRHAHNNSTPGSSFSSSTTPEDVARTAWGSPFTPGGPAIGTRMPMQRVQTYDGCTTNMLHDGMQSFSQPLESFWNHGPMQGPNHGEDRNPDFQHRNGPGPLGEGDAYNGGNLSLFHRRVQQNPNMSRVTSAPSLAPLSISTGADGFSVPSTPSDCPPGSAVSWASSIPSTPGDAHLNLSPGFGSAGMVHSRSQGALPSSMSPISISPLTLHDGTPYHTPSRSTGGSFSEASFDGYGSPQKALRKGRSNSKSAGTTPRKPGGRSSVGAPPPLVVSSADKVHVCHCGKRFKRMEHLKRHNRTHTQERPHKCPVEGCGKYFGRTDNLAQHLKTHFRATGLARASQQLLAMSNSQGEHLDLRHDPHAAAAQAAAAAVRAASDKRRSSTINHPSQAEEVLGGPISLTKQGQQLPHQIQQQQQQPPHHHQQQQQQHPHQSHQQQQQQSPSMNAQLGASPSANTSPAAGFNMSGSFQM